MCGGAAAGRTGVGEGGRAGRGPGTGTADGEPRATTVNRKNKLVSLWSERTCIQAMLHVVDKLLSAGSPGGSHHLVITADLQPVSDVVPHRTRKQHRLLPDQGHLRRGMRAGAVGAPRGSPSSSFSSPRMDSCVVPTTAGAPSVLGSSPPSPAPLPPRPPVGAGSGVRTGRWAPRRATAAPRWAGTDSAAGQPLCSSQTHWVPPVQSPDPDTG